VDLRGIPVVVVLVLYKDDIIMVRVLAVLAVLVPASATPIPVVVLPRSNRFHHLISFF
jgi:hypothetical protein